MCGRFTQVVKAGELAALYGPAASLPDTAWPECWNGTPTQPFLACRLDAAGRRVLSLLRWGLVPSWARDRAIGSRLINARSETVHEKPAFRAAFRRRRCLVPVVDGCDKAHIFGEHERERLPPKERSIRR